MTTDEIKARVEAIRAMADDPERAHAAEDKLRADFILTVLGSFPAECTLVGQQAKLILSTDEIEFPRTC